jgi:hypothetical protein
MRSRFPLIAGTLAAAIYCVPSLGDEGRTVPPENLGSDRYQSYLDAVRAQRLSAMEARRKAMRESAENHRKMVAPWSETYRRSMEKRTQRHQQESQVQREQIEKLRTDREKHLLSRNPPSYWDNSWYYWGY